MMELDAELVGGYAWAEMIESNQFPWNLRPFPLASPVSLSDSMSRQSSLAKGHYGVRDLLASAS